MELPKSVRITVAVFMAAILTNIPYMAAAEAIPAMIPTSVVVEQMSMNEARAKVEAVVNREDVKSELIKRGVSPAEVNARIASLSEREMRQLASQMEAAQFGGDVTGILIVVVLVLLIIFLVRRV